MPHTGGVEEWIETMNVVTAQESSSVESLRDGDVFRWHYREPGDDRAWGRYHCCSNIAIVRNGRLHDTYWPSFIDGKSFGKEDLAKLNLERLGNLSELTKVPEYNSRYYDDADIVNLNHANSSRDNFYIRNGAQRSAAKMLASAKAEREKVIGNVRYANERSERLLEIITKIEAGDTSVHL